MTLGFTIRSERPEDKQAINDVHLSAFGPSEPIASLVQKLREVEGALTTISLVACDTDNQIIGHVMISHNWVDAPAALIDILVLSPLAVAAKSQRQGVGTALLNNAIQCARATKSPLLILEGNPAFYGERGFETAKSLGIRSPSLRIPERALQAMRLPEWNEEITGTLVYRDLWWELDCVGLR